LEEEECRIWKVELSGMWVKMRRECTSFNGKKRRLRLHPPQLGCIGQGLEE